MTLQYIGMAMIAGFIHYTIFIHFYYLFYYRKSACTLFIMERYGMSEEKADRKRQKRLISLQEKIPALVILFHAGFSWIAIMAQENPSVHNRMQCIGILSAICVAYPLHILILNFTFKNKIGFYKELEWMALMIAGVFLCVFIGLYV